MDKACIRVPNVIAEGITNLVSPAYFSYYHKQDVVESRLFVQVIVNFHAESDH